MDRLVEVVVDGGGSGGICDPYRAGVIIVAAVGANGSAGARMICVANSTVSGVTWPPPATRSRSASISSALW